MDHDEIIEKLRQQQIDWKLNPPAASHMGGAWERQIRTTRRILDTLLRKHGNRLNDESLQTVMCEVEAVINSRPLTMTSSDANDPLPRTSNQILTTKTSIVLPLLASFIAMTFTCDVVGAEFNTCATCSGKDGNANNCRHCKSAPNGIKKGVISK